MEFAVYERKKHIFTPFFKQLVLMIGVVAAKISVGCAVGFITILSSEIMKPQSKLYVSQETLSWIASAPTFFHLIGGALSSLIMKKYGRKRCLQICNVPAIVSWILFASATNVSMLIAAKLLQAFGGGLLMSVAPVFISECTSPKLRAVFLGCLLMSIAIGKFFVHFVGSLISWTATSYVCLALPTLSFVTLTFSPETPYWLSSKNRMTEAKESFFTLRGISENKRREIELLIMYRSKSLNQQANSNKLNFLMTFQYYINIFKEKSFYQPASILVFSIFAYQFSLVDILPTFSRTILTELEIKTGDINYVMNFIDLVRIVATLINLIILTMCKRRTIFIFGTSLTIFMMLLISVYNYLTSVNYVTFSMPTWLITLLLSLFVFASTIGTGSLLYTVPGEVVPLNYKEIGGLITNLAICLSYFITAKYTLSLISTLGLYGTLLIYSFVVTVCLIYLYYVLPETRGKKMLEIEEKYKGDIICNLKILQNLQFDK